MPNVEAVSAQSCSTGGAPVMIAASNSTPPPQSQAEMSTTDVVALTGGLLAAGAVVGLIGAGVHASLRKSPQKQADAAPNTSGTGDALSSRAGAVPSSRSGETRRASAPEQISPNRTAPNHSAANNTAANDTAPSSPRAQNNPTVEHVADPVLRLAPDAPALHHLPSATHFYHEAQCGALCAKHSFNAVVHALGGRPLSVDQYRSILRDQREEYAHHPNFAHNGGELPADAAIHTLPVTDYGGHDAITALIEHTQRATANTAPVITGFSHHMEEDFNPAGHAAANQMLHDRVALERPRAAMVCHETAGQGGHWAALLPVNRPSGTRWKIVDSQNPSSQEHEYPSLVHATDGFTSRPNAPLVTRSRGFVFFR